jgi:hypothetical protein
MPPRVLSRSLAACVLAAGVGSAVASPLPMESTVCTGCIDVPLERDDNNDNDNSWRQPRRLRAVVELGVVLGLGAAWYWIERERQVADWDFPSIRDRFRRESYVNDNNPLSINYGWHTLGGTYFHLVGRSNDLGLIESTLFGLGASLAWEYGIEFREMLSINDVLVTTVAGVAAGEFLHWFGRLLQQRDGGGIGDAARWSVGLLQTAHDTIDRRRGPRGTQVAASLRLSSGYAHVATERDNGGLMAGQANLGQLRFEGQLAAFDRHMQPGWRRATFRDGNLTSLDAALAGGSGSSVRLVADTVVFGLRHERVSAEGEGFGLVLGTSVGVRYQDENFDAWRDRLGAVHFPGFAADAVVRGRNWSARGSARAHFDHAGVHALTYDRWVAANPMERGKSVLIEQGYYYAWGASTRLTAELNASRFTLGAAKFHGRYRSQQGFDRDQDKVTVDQVGTAQFTDLSIWLRGRITDRAFLEYRHDRHSRSGELEGITGTSSAQRRTIELGAYF